MEEDFFAWAMSGGFNESQAENSKCYIGGLYRAMYRAATLKMNVAVWVPPELPNLIHCARN